MSHCTNFSHIFRLTCFETQCVVYNGVYIGTDIEDGYIAWRLASFVIEFRTSNGWTKTQLLSMIMTKNVNSANHTGPWTAYFYVLPSPSPPSTWPKDNVSQTARAEDPSRKYSGFVGA